MILVEGGVVKHRVIRSDTRMRREKQFKSCGLVDWKTVGN